MGGLVRMDSCARQIRSAPLLTILVGVAVGMVLFTPGCGGGGGGGGGVLSSEFFVVDQTPQTPFRYPRVGEVGFDSNNALILQFTAPIDPITTLDSETITGTAATIRITATGGERVPAMAFVGGRDANGNPPPNFDEEIMNDAASVLRIVADTDGDLDTLEAFSSAGAEFTIFVSTAVRTLGGKSLSRSFCATYYVGLSSGNPPPYVTSTSPPANTNNVGLLDPIIVNFSEEIDPISIIGEPGSVSFPRNIVLRAFNPQSGVTIPPSQITGTVTRTFEGSNCSFTFLPDNPLPAQSVVTVIVKSSTDPNNLGNAGVRDMLGRPLIPFFARPGPSASAFRFSVVTRVGPPIANNPIPPQAIFFGALNPSRFGVIGSDTSQDFNGNSPPNLSLDTDGDNVPTAADDNIIAPNSENNAIGAITAIEIGRPITELVDPACELAFVGTFAGAGNFIDSPPNPNPPPPPGFNSTATCIVNSCGSLSLMPNGSNADLGFHVYVADSESNVVQVINSVTSQVIDTIATPDPTGLVMDPDMTALYVTNFGANTVSVIDTDPFSRRLHQVVRTIPVGAGPRGIAVQSDQEDILVCNSIESSLSIIAHGTLTVRKTLTTLVGPEPWDVTVTGRQSPVFPFGTGTYFAFITNRAGNSVSVFESGPTTPVYFGPDDINQVFSQGPAAPFTRPMGIVSNRLYGVAAGALFVCNGNASVAEIQLISFQRPPSPNFPSPGELRTFSVIRQSDPGDPRSPLFGTLPTDICVSDAVALCGFGPLRMFQVNGKQWHTVGSVQGLGGKRVYVATNNRIVVLDRFTYLPVGDIPVPGVQVVESFFN